MTFKQVVVTIVAGCGLLLAGSTIPNSGPAASLGRIFYVVADANCVQTTMDPNQIPFAYEPNQVLGDLIGVIECTAGTKFNQEGDWCDPENDPVTITLGVSPAWVSMTVNSQLKQFTLAGMAPNPGVYYITLELVDDPTGGIPERRVATIILRADVRPNTAPAIRLLSPMAGN